LVVRSQYLIITINPVNATEGITLDDQAAANGGNPGNAAEVIADSKSSTYGSLAIFGKSSHSDSNLDNKHTIDKKLDNKHIINNRHILR
jgi:hypothetical protein